MLWCRRSFSRGSQVLQQEWQLMGDPRITVVLPVYNGGPLLVRQLLALALESQSSAFELVVVDNRSTDGSADLARETLARFAPPLPWRLVPALEQQGLGYARNVGGSAVDTELMCFCDQDDVVAPGWVAGHLRAGARNELWTGRIVGAGLNRRRTPGTDGPSYANIKVLGFLPSVAGSNFGMSKKFFEMMGGFSAEIPSCEDLEFSWRAQTRFGVVIGTADDAIVLRQYRQGALAVYRQGRWYGAGQQWLKQRYGSYGMPADRWNQRLLLRVAKDLPAAAKADSTSIADVAYCLGLLRGRVAARPAIWSES